MRLLETAVAVTTENSSILQRIWAETVKLYASYSGFIHSIFPEELGDFVEYMIDIVLVILIIRIIGKAAFSKGDGSI